MNTKSKSYDHPGRDRGRERARGGGGGGGGDLFIFNDDTVELMATVHSRKWRPLPLARLLGEHETRGEMLPRDVQEGEIRLRTNVPFFASMEKWCLNRNAGP